MVEKGLERESDDVIVGVKAEGLKRFIVRIAMFKIIHDITLTPQEQALIMRLKSFRVPEMAHILEEQLKDPNADLNTFMERMTAMVDAEWQARADKRFNRLMKEAHLRYPAADLDETIYRPERQLDTQTISYNQLS